MAEALGIPSSDQQWLDLAGEVLEIEAQGLLEVKSRLDPGFVRALELLANCQGRVVVTGVGKSGLVGRKIAATLSSTGTPAFFLHPVEGAHGDLGMIRPDDLVLAISNSGETDELNNILPSLAALGVRLIGLTGDTDSSLARMCEACVNTRVQREACPLGLAPTASTTASLAVGDALAVCLIRWKSFDTSDFQRVHPGGTLGQRLRQDVRNYMHDRGLPLVTPEASLHQALGVLDKGGLGVVIVTGPDGRLEGILTDGDIRRRLARGTLDLASPIAEVMTRSPRTAQPGHSAAKVLDIMESHAITVMPIVEHDRKVIGLVHLHDLLGKGRLKFARNGGAET